MHPCRYTLDVMVCDPLLGPSDYRTARHVAWTIAIAASGLAVALYVSPPPTSLTSSAMLTLL